MSSYLLMMFILLFGGAILIGATLDFIGLGPANAISLGLMMNNAVLWSALQLGDWWWFVPPGVGIVAIVGALYVDERRPGRGLQPAAAGALMTLRVEDLRVYYRSLEGDVQALDGVSFGLADGEIMGLAGESGCGKSTLGNSLIRMDGRMRHVGGTVELDGEELPIADNQRMNAFRFAKVSIVPQYAMSALNPTRRSAGSSPTCSPRAARPRRRAAELGRRLDLVGLSRDVLGMYPMELSGGMKQRMVMVISTLLDPSLLIADEITSALDVSTQKAVAETLVGFRDRGFVKSMIVITHDLSILNQIADTILVMYAGKLAEKAPTRTIVEQPRHPYTRLLISSLPEVGVRYSERKLTGIPGKPPSLLHPPDGCRFRDRCPLASAKCRQEPPFVAVNGDGHLVACWEANNPAALDATAVSAVGAG